MDSEANVPNATFNYSIATLPDTVAPTTDHILVAETWTDNTHTTMQSPRVYATANNTDMVSGTPTVDSSLTFAPGHLVYSTAQGTDTVDLTGGKKYAKETMTIDFTGVTFKQPGVYRFKLSEANTTQDGITNDALLDRYIDVYVNQKAGSTVSDLEIQGYTAHRSADAIPALNAAWSSSLKDAGFQNDYATYDLTVTKNIAGNHGYKNQLFDFTITLAGNPSTRYYVEFGTTDTDNAVGATIGDTLTANVASLTADGTKYYVTTNASGAATLNFKLSDKDYIVVKGLTATTEYAISEDNQDYNPSWTVDTLGTENDATGSTASIASRAMLAQDNDVVFTNTRETALNTGVVMTIAPFAATGLAGAAGIFALARKSKKSKEEDDEEVA